MWSIWTLHLSRCQVSIDPITGPFSPYFVASLCLFCKCIQCNYSDELIFRVTRLHKFKSATILAARSHHFAAEVSSCNHNLYSKKIFSYISHLWCSRVLASLPSTIFNNLNLTSIAIFCFSETCPFIVLCTLLTKDILFSFIPCNPLRPSTIITLIVVNSLK